MKIFHWMAAASLTLMLGCQPRGVSTTTILDNDQIHSFTSSARIPAQLIAEAGITLTASDLVLLNGSPVPIDQPLDPAPDYLLQIQRAIAVTINGTQIQTAADTVGASLTAAGIQPYTADEIDPPANTALTPAMVISYKPSQPLTITVEGRQIQARSSAQTIGGALAEAGIALVGLDYSRPPENQGLPQDGRIRVVRVSESILVAQRPIAFNTDYQSSSEVALDQQKTLQAGQAGLALSRTVIRYEDGKEISRQTEPETVVRPPIDRVIAYGTKVEVQTITVGGVPIQYWRVLQMYATAYSPCNSGSAGQCYTGTSSGLPAGKGVVAVDPSLYASLAGQKLYIAGYGFAVIGDVGGGYIIEKLLGISRKRWIDLGFSDAEYAQVGDQWSKYVTVYFLAPVPANINALN